MTEEYENGIPLLKALPQSEIDKLPPWVIAEAANARLGEKSSNSVIFSDGRKYLISNPINELTGSEWTKFLCSVLNTNYPTSGQEGYAHKIRKIHPTPKPPQLMRSLIEFFTKSDDTVLDYFMGVGGSLIGASLCGRRAVGIDINPLFIDTYKKANAELGLTEQVTAVGDCSEILSDDTRISELLGGRQAGMILIDPPYANMMAKEKTGADIEVYGKTATPFSDLAQDLGNMPYDKFLTALTDVVRSSLRHLKTKGYLVVFCKDMQPKKKTTNLLHAAIIESLNSIDKLYYRGLKIWADQSSKLFPYGYPFDFVANQIHQYILVFRKY